MNLYWKGTWERMLATRTVTTKDTQSTGARRRAGQDSPRTGQCSLAGAPGRSALQPGHLRCPRAGTRDAAAWPRALSGETALKQGMRAAFDQHQETVLRACGDYSTCVCPPSHCSRRKPAETVCAEMSGQPGASEQQWGRVRCPDGA